MQIADPTKYTDVTQEQFDRFKNLARARGMNIGGNSDNVKFDEIPVHVEFKPDAEELNFTIHQPHWLAQGVTAGVLHTMVAAAMVKPEQPVVEHEKHHATRNHKH